MKYHIAENGQQPTQPSNQVMPKTWLTEAVIVTVLSFLCFFNILGIITGVASIIEANTVQTKFMRGDVQGANAVSSSAKKWVIITSVVVIAWSCFNGYQLLNNPGLLERIKGGSWGFWESWGALCFSWAVR